MIAVASLLIVITLSLMVTRIGATALTLTGVSQDLASFQARSAFSGVGFTTSESERVVNHPVRRRIVMALMLSGNVGVVTAVSSLILTFVRASTAQEFASRLIILLLGLVILTLLATNKIVNRYLSRSIGWGLARWTDLEVHDYDSLLQLSGGYRIQEVVVHEYDWLANKSLAELNLSQEGILVLGVRRADGTYVGSPQGKSYLFPEDTLILYGRHSLLTELGSRERGEIGEGAHQEAMLAQQRILDKQEINEAARDLYP